AAIGSRSPRTHQIPVGAAAAAIRHRRGRPGIRSRLKPLLQTPVRALGILPTPPRTAPHGTHSSHHRRHPLIESGATLSTPFNEARPWGREAHDPHLRKPVHHPVPG